MVHESLYFPNSHIQYGLNTNLKINVNFDGLEIPSEFTFDGAHWNTPKPVRPPDSPGAPIKTKVDSMTDMPKRRKLNFDAGMTSQDAETESLSSAVRSIDLSSAGCNKNITTVDGKRDILCPETPEPNRGSPLICLETIMEDSHSDCLFDTDTAPDSDAEMVDIVRGREAKNSFQVRFGCSH